VKKVGESQKKLFMGLADAPYTICSLINAINFNGKRSQQILPVIF